MKLIRKTRIALKTLFIHKIRTILSTLGIVIGVSAVIVMSSIGEGSQKQVLSKIQAMGTDLVLVTAGQVKVFAGRQRQTGNVTTLTLRDVKAISDEGEHIAAATPAQSRKLLVKSGASSAMTIVAGTGEEIIQIKGLNIASGRFFNEDDIKTFQRVAVIGKTVSKNLFEGKDPVGEKIRIGKVTFDVVGLLGEKGTDFYGSDQDDIIYIPVTTALRRLFNLTYINNIYVQAKDSTRIEAAATEIREILREKHRLKEKPDDFTIQTQTELLRTEKETSRTFKNLISSVAAISLTIGGIGILAVMLISVRERTPEIGLKRAVGALKRDIIIEFIIESLTLSISGGIAGIVTGVLLSVISAYFTALPLGISFSSVLTAFLFAALIGIVFGVYPAVKAARLDPIEALRSE